MRQEDISNLAMKPLISLGEYAVGGLHEQVTLDVRYVNEAFLRNKLERAEQTNGEYQDAWFAQSGHSAFDRRCPVSRSHGDHR